MIINDNYQHICHADGYHRRIKGNNGHTSNHLQYKHLYLLYEDGNIRYKEVWLVLEDVKP